MIPKNVTFDKKSNKYRAYVTIGQKKINLGSFSTPQEAQYAANTYSKKFRDPHSGSYTLNSLYSNSQLLTLYKDYINSNKNKKISFRSYVFQMYPKKIESYPNSESLLTYITTLYLNSNSEDFISHIMNIPRRKIHSEILSLNNKILES